jgi:hypothetical protein
LTLASQCAQSVVVCTGWTKADVPPLFAAHVDQSGLGGADGCGSGLAGHGRPGQELRVEVLDSDGVVVADTFLTHLRPVPSRCLATFFYGFAPR